MIEVVARTGAGAGGVERFRGMVRLVALLALLAKHDPFKVARGRSGEEARARPGGASGGDGARTSGAMVDEVYALHARAVLAYLCARLPSLADAEDSLSDVFEAALGACAEGETPGIGWLMRVASRRVADFYRERQRRPVGPLAEDSGAHPAAGPAHDPEEWAVRAEERVALWALVARLPEDQREALALRFAAGLRSREVAAVMGRSDEATRALLSRALRRLRKEWAE